MPIKAEIHLTHRLFEKVFNRRRQWCGACRLWALAKVRWLELVPFVWSCGFQELPSEDFSGCPEAKSHCMPGASSSVKPRETKRVLFDDL